MVAATSLDAKAEFDEVELCLTPAVTGEHGSEDIASSELPVPLMVMWW